MRAPIVILSFNRAQYLGPVLASMQSQAGQDLCLREIHLFQDGAVNRYSGLRYAADADIEASIETFRRAFPRGVVHASPDNIGIAENFRRAERYVFEEREFPCAWFFEDDLELGPAYFAMMEKLQNFALNVGHVAYFAAYGNYHAPPAEIRERGRQLITLDHHWGFGLVAHHWRAMQASLQGFYAAVVGTDYARRDHQRLLLRYADGPLAPRASSQDAAKAVVCSELGLWRCNTVMPFARYIGTSGQHMTPEQFDALGFANAAVAAEAAPDLEFPGPSQIRERVVEERELFRRIRTDELAGILAGLPAKMLNPKRPATAADVAAAYFLLLRRGPDAAAGALGQPVGALVAAILSSPEFRCWVDPTAAEFTFRAAPPRRACTAQDLVNAYTLLVHREPEPDAVKHHAGRTPVDLLVQGILRSPEYRDISGRLGGGRAQ